MASALLFFILLGPTDKPLPVALVLSVEGNVTERALECAPEALRRGALVRPGSHLTSTSTGSALLYFVGDGHTERILPSSKVIVWAEGGKPHEAVERMVAARRLSKPNLSRLREFVQSSQPAIGEFRGGSLAELHSAVTPIFGATILDTRPSFTWPKRADAGSYRFSVFNILPDKDELLWTVSVSEAHLNYPRNKEALGFGEAFRWRAIVSKGPSIGVVAAEGKFFTITKRQLKGIAELRELAQSKDTGDLVLAATSYEANGLYGEALATYERLAKTLPNEPTFEHALEFYYLLAGQPEKSKTAKKRAEQLLRAKPMP